jgi:hypothetical protein
LTSLLSVAVVAVRSMVLVVVVVGIFLPPVVIFPQVRTP